LKVTRLGHSGWGRLLGLALAVMLPAFSAQAGLSPEGSSATPEASKLIRTLADEPLDVVFSDAILALPDYVYVDERGLLAGRLIDMWACVFERVGIKARYRLLPNLRAMHELFKGRADFHGAKINIGTVLKARDGEVHYTEVVTQVHEILLVRRADRHLLGDEPWWQRRVGVVKATLINQKVEALGGVISVRTANFQRVLKLLVSGRVDVVLYLSNLPGEEFKRFQGHDIEGRTLSRVNGHGLLSAARHRVSPDLLGRINREIPICKLILSRS